MCGGFMELSKQIVNKMLQTAKKTLKNSYSPYSKFRVAAAVLSKSGKIYGGTNVENASYGLTICAERCAIFKAISEGEKQFLALLIIVSQKPSLPEATPCGACRQVLAEFAKPDTPVYTLNILGKQKMVKRTLAEYLPKSFTPKNLQ